MTTPRTRSRLAASLVLFALMSVAVVAPSVHAGPRRGPEPTSDELGTRMLALVNRSRAAHGLPTLRLNERLTREALRHSKRMAQDGAITHTPNLADLVRSVGGSVFGEDLGKAPLSWIREYADLPADVTAEDLAAPADRARPQARGARAARPRHHRARS